MAHYIKTLRIILILFIFGALAPNIHAFQKDDKDSTDIDLLLKKKKYDAIQVITGDTTDVIISDDDTPVLPGSLDYDYSAVQDSNYYRAMRLEMTPLARLQSDLDHLRSHMEVRRRIRSGTPWQIALKNMEDIPRELLKPSPMEIVQRQINIINALKVPFVNTYNPYGLKIPMGAIGQFIGLTEDCSPRITYTLEHPAEVEVVVYSVDATVIATLFKGQQPEGTYRLSWNGRNDKGRRMPSGDYIGEVRIGKSRYVRKCIKIP
jgi:hypothetical protein